MYQFNIKVILNYFDMSLEIVKINNYINSNSILSLTITISLGVMSLVFIYLFCWPRHERRREIDQFPVNISLAPVLLPVNLQMRLANWAYLTPMERQKLKAKIWAFQKFGMTNFR